MIHRTCLGSLERFIGILIEHYAGAFPTWLAPIQARILPITDRQLSYARRIFSGLESAGIRAEVDERNEKIGYKIRDARLQKVPYMLVVGAREAKAGKVSVRHRDHGDCGIMSLEAFSGSVLAEIESRSIEGGISIDD
jgi:threonyl-tRNA synthetase